MIMLDDAPVHPPWMAYEIPDGSSPPQWDQEDADGLVGQLVLAGLTYVAADGNTVTSQVQCWGRIVSAKPEGTAIVCEGKLWLGQTTTLPPHLAAFQAAGPRQYRLHSTGETTENPDLTTSWTITAPSKS
jgi:hypothetical protein